MNKHSTGFTLLEMLITVVIIGVLAAIAIPNYQAQVEKTRRSDARIALVETSQRLERCFAQFGSYNHASCTVAAPVLEYYTISILSRTASTYSLSAAVNSDGAQKKDTHCATLTFDHTGQQAALDSDGEPSPADCWR